ncbi:MAG: hypothetical protein ABIH34_05225 [Nanoarchaeota archaeon]
MTDLIACLGTGKGTWAELSSLIKAEEWDNIYLVTNEFGTKFQAKAEFIIINENMSYVQMRDIIQSQLQPKIRSTQVALNLTSGTGKEHMAILAAVLKLGVGIRLVALAGSKLIEV